MRSAYGGEFSDFLEFVWRKNFLYRATNYASNATENQKKKTKNLIGGSWKLEQIENTVVSTAFIILEIVWTAVVATQNIILLSKRIIAVFVFNYGLFVG